MHAHPLHVVQARQHVQDLRGRGLTASPPRTGEAALLPSVDRTMLSANQPVTSLWHWRPMVCWPAETSPLSAPFLRAPQGLAHSPVCRRVDILERLLPDGFCRDACNEKQPLH